MEGKYEDLLHLPHHTSTTRPPMSMRDRAAQFSPFAALTGYEAAVEETARLTEDETVLTEEMKLQINDRLLWLRERLSDPPTVTLTYFVPDLKKSGGETVRRRGRITEIDELEGIVTLSTGKRIPMEQILGLDGDCFVGEAFEIE